MRGRAQALPRGISGAVLGADEDDAAHGIRAVVRRPFDAGQDFDGEDGARGNLRERAEVHHIRAVHEHPGGIVEEDAAAAAPLELCRLAVALLTIPELRRQPFHRFPRVQRSRALDLGLADQDTVTVVAGWRGSRSRMEARGAEVQYRP